MYDRDQSPQAASEAAIRELEHAAAAHMEWLKRVHCSLLFHDNVRPLARPLPQAFTDWVEAGSIDKLAEGSVRQDALDKLRKARARMQAQAGVLTARAAAGEAISPDDYLSFMNSVEAYARQVRAIEQQLRQALVETDPLTGVRNRHGMMRDLRREWTRMERTGQSCCVALVDLDHFKAINDTYGHYAGDRVLKTAAHFFVRRLRSYDMVYRYGGEEFLFCLPNTDTATGSRVLDRLRGLMARLPVPLEDGTKVRVTASLGLAQMTPGEPVEATVARADEALYEAKAAGRNRIIIAAIERLKHRAEIN